MKLWWCITALLVIWFVSAGLICGDDKPGECTRFVSDEMRRERAQYEFLQHCFSPERLEDAAMRRLHGVPQAIVALGLSGFASLATASMIKKLFFDDVASPQGLVGFIVHNTVDTKKIERNAFKGVVILAGVLLFPYMYRFVGQQRIGFVNYGSVLSDFIRDWPDYRICTPAKLHQFFETLYLIFHANNKQLLIKEDEAALLVAMINVVVDGELCS